MARRARRSYWRRSAPRSRRHERGAVEVGVGRERRGLELERTRAGQTPDVGVVANGDKGLQVGLECHVPAEGVRGTGDAHDVPAKAAVHVVGDRIAIHVAVRDPLGDVRAPLVVAPHLGLQSRERGSRRNGPTLYPDPPSESLSTEKFTDTCHVFRESL